MKTLLLLSFLLSSSAEALEPLSEKALLEIASSEHDSKLLVKALQIYPKAREYDILITTKDVDGEEFEAKATAKEKWVGGRYIVSESQSPDPKSNIFMIVDFDKETKVYRKHIIFKQSNKLIGYHVGTRVGDSRSIAWIEVSRPSSKHYFHILMTETHTDKTTSWRTTNFIDGKFHSSETGVATVTK